MAEPGIFTNLFTALQNGVAAINNVSQTLKTTFPQSVSVSSATLTSSGTITFNSSLAQGFLTVTTSSGATYKVALYT